MKFDCIIMNPPYQKNLHLKILEKAISKLSDQGKCICLAPSPYTNYKNYKNFNILPSSYEKISPNLASTLFNGIQLQDCLLISEWQKSKHLPMSVIIDDFVPKAYFIIKKLKYTKTFKDVNVLNYNNEEFFVPLKLMTARWDKNKNDIIDKLGLIINGKVEDGRNYKSVRTRNSNRPCGGIPFKSEIEARNFISSCRTLFFRFIVKMQHTNSRYILKDYPFMDDYTEPWTDERFYKHFNITKEEQKIIEETMEKYS